MDALDSFEIDTANVRNATLFTVRDREEVLEPVRNLVEKTFAADHPVRNVEVHYQSYFGRKAALITGELVTKLFIANIRLGAAHCDCGRHLDIYHAAGERRSGWPRFADFQYREIKGSPF